MKYKVEKNILINASLPTVRSFVENFNRWNSWSPWIVVEPNCPIKFSGNEKEVGHSMTWDGKIIGSGRNTVKSYDEKRIFYNLEFFRPWKSKAETGFIFENVGGQTKVTWTMSSSLPFFMFFMIKTMKNWVGMDYERGLRMLKEVSEKGKVECSTINQGIIDYKGFSYVGIKRSVTFSEMPSKMKKDFEKLVEDIVIKGEKKARHWVCLYPKFDMKNMNVTYIAAISDEDLKGFQIDPLYVKGNINDSKALEIKHQGPYEFLGNAWSMGMMYLNSQKVKQKNYPFEQYWNSPMETKDKDLLTSVYFPIKVK